MRWAGRRGLLLRPSDSTGRGKPVRTGFKTGRTGFKTGFGGLRKKLLILGFVGVFLLGVAATSLASHLADHALTADDAGVSFSGTWEWYTASEGHGGWHFWGTLSDTNCGDGDNVYSKVKVMGYSPNSFYGNACGNKSQNWEVYDYQATTTTHAQYWACRDRSAPFSDNCSDEVREYFR